MARVKLSTSNNPYNPFDQYDEWEAFDENVCGYYTNSYLDRIAFTSPDLSGPDNERKIEEAIDEIVQMDLYLLDPITGERAHYIKITDPYEK